MLYLLADILRSKLPHSEPYLYKLLKITSPFFESLPKEKEHSFSTQNDKFSLNKNLIDIHILSSYYVVYFEHCLKYT